MSKKIHIPASSVPALQTVADGLTERLGKQFNFAHAYLALLSAEQAGAINPQEWADQPGNPVMLDQVAALLHRYPDLMEELLQQKQLKDARKLVEKDQ